MEYDREGDTKRIPDARSFRPLKRGVLGLRRYQVEVVGQLVFVSLSPSPRSLDEQLGGQRSYLEDLFSDRWAPLLTVEQEVDANWKVLAENVLEGYHLEEVHKNTFKKEHVFPGRVSPSYGPGPGPCGHILAHICFYGPIWFRTITKNT